MWHKSDGDGVLEGAMARLLKMAVAAYVEELHGSDCWDDNTRDREWIDRARENWLNVAQVKRMEHGQRLHMIATAAHALLERSVAAPELTADTEATVYQIYQFLCAATDIEYDMFDKGDPDMPPSTRLLLTSTRRAIADAVRELGLCEEDSPCGECEYCAPDMDASPETWHELIETLADSVLWDRDWELEGAIGDADPAIAAAVKSSSGIGEGYFTTPAEEPTVRQVVQAKAYLDTLAAEIRAEDEALAGTQGRFPSRCPECNGVVELKIFPYTTKFKHNGELRRIHVDRLVAPKCNNCGEVYFSTGTETQIMSALHQEYGERQGGN